MKIHVLMQTDQAVVSTRAIEYFNLKKYIFFINSELWMVNYSVGSWIEHLT